MNIYIGMDARTSVYGVTLRGVEKKVDGGGVHLLGYGFGREPYIHKYAHIPTHTHTKGPSTHKNKLHTRPDRGSSDRV